MDSPELNDDWPIHHREHEIVLRPDRPRDGGALGQRLAMLVGEVGLVHRQSNSAQPPVGARSMPQLAILGSSCPIPGVIEQEYSFSETLFTWPCAMGVIMFETERFVADCREAFAQDPTQKAVREVLASAVSDPTAVLKGLGEPQRAEIQKIFHSDALTILNVIWAPGMMVMPHNHRMWAVIGIYTGREDNVFWRRLKGMPNKIEAVGAKALCEMDAEPLGTDIIHSVINPINKLTGAIHIYGGDFFAAERSEWDSMTLFEHRSDGERVRRVFEEANARYEASKHIGVS